jgi:hypothetical protein
LSTGKTVSLADREIVLAVPGRGVHGTGATLESDVIH